MFFFSFLPPLLIGVVNGACALSPVSRDENPRSTSFQAGSGRTDGPFGARSDFLAFYVKYGGGRYMVIGEISRCPKVQRGAGMALHGIIP